MVTLGRLPTKEERFMVRLVRLRRKDGEMCVETVS